jgi:glycosyltransferase involved in cell wall biosynthesis
MNKQLNKIKLLTLGDHPLVPSGVGGQSKYIFEGLLDTGRYQIRSVGGAMKHQDYRPVKTDKYGDDWIIYPFDGYGNPQFIRDVIDHEKPDAIWFITDPRFYGWLFEMSDEIRDRGIPLLYYHVWDEYPVPKYNLPFYQSCDFIGCISRLTHDIVRTLGLGDRSEYIPHAVDSKMFAPLPLEEVAKHKAEILGVENVHKFVFFYNSRNARRKMTADVIKNFRLFCDEVGDDKALLFMHTDPFDQEGSNLYAVCEAFNIKPEQIRFSPNGQPPEMIARFYNISDVTINISNNEGFGLSCLESLSCGRLAIVNMTGGLQDQIKDENGVVFGVGIKPATKSVQGSQQIPYIYDCRVADKDVVQAMLDLYDAPPDSRRRLGAKAREWTLRAFSMERMVGSWDAAIQKYVETYRNFGTTTKIKFASL